MENNDLSAFLDENEKEILKYNLNIKRLGECTFDSTLKFSTDKDDESRFVPDNEKVMVFIDESIINNFKKLNLPLPMFEKAGPRKKLFFEPGETNSAIVTCGGLCPGLNSVIRGIVMMNYYRYGNKRIYGIKYGYAGLVKELGHDIMLLTPDIIEGIQFQGGSILGSSRGNQDPVLIVDRLVELKVNVLYTIGGDGTQRGAMSIIEEIERRGLKISVIGIPKTIDNDINFIDKSFGMETAFSKACEAIIAAHNEARASYNGIGIVKVMGRESGFIAANATIATNEVNFCLIPELPFDLEGPNGFLTHLEKRLLKRKHCVIVVAEGAGQEYVLDPNNIKYDASGNVKLGDIGLFLKQKIKEYLDRKKIQHSIKYIDPSYIIRSCSPTPNDSIFCSQLAQMAVHAGMSGRTKMVIGYRNGQFVHIPMELATSKRKKIDLDSQLWLSVLEATGQPTSFKNN